MNAAIINEILELLKWDLILSIDVKEKVKMEVWDLSQEQGQKLIFILKKLRLKQEEILKDKLKEEPWLFTKLEVVASNSIYWEHLAIEKKELEWIEESLIEKINTL